MTTDFKPMLVPEATDFKVEDTGDGVRISWAGRLPYDSEGITDDFLFQSYKQAVDLDDKLRKALGISE